MPSRMPQRTYPRTWNEILTSSTTLYNCFVPYQAILLGINTTPDIAFNRMYQNYEEGITTYTEDYILTIFENNLAANRKKYEELINIYQANIDILNPISITEQYTDVRTPDLTSTSTSSGTGSATSTRNQTQTTLSNPGSTTTTTHSVNPYDNTGFKDESKDTVVDSGSNTTTVSYSGSPDSSTTTSTATGTVTSGGTETIEHTLTRTGRDGKINISELLEEAELSAVRLNILDAIINDLADQIFIQVWL